MDISHANLSPNCIATMLATVHYAVNTKQSTGSGEPQKLDSLDMNSPFATWEARIGWIRKYRGYRSNAALAKACGVSVATINNLLKRERDTDGNARLDPRSSIKISTEAKVDHMWLITGEGLPDTRVTIDDGLDIQKANEARRQAAAALSRLDGIDEKEAAFVLQSIDLPPEQATEAMAYYAAARLKLGAPEGLARGRLLAERNQIGPRTDVRESRPGKR